MVESKELTCQEALQAVLRAEIPSANYAIGYYMEDAVCLKKNGDQEWKVFVGFRNNEDDLTIFKNIVEACIDVIKRLCINDIVLLEKLKDEFFDMIISDKVA